MRAMILTTLFALSACATAPDPSLAGAWRLERYVDTPEGGAPVMAFGEHPEGLFVFTADGHASISMMRNPRTAASVVDPDPDACQPDWYCSYFGTYDVDWARHEWVVHVTGGNIPSFIGTDQTRGFTIDGDRIVLSGEYEDADGGRVLYERILVRANATQ